MVNTGTEYELFVANLQQALLDAENYAKQKNIKVEVNKLIFDNCGIERQFDIYWEYELGGLTYKTVIECKDYNSNVSVDKIDALIGKTKDIPDLKAVLATKKGYQSGAKTKADQNKIDLLIVREQNDSDWIDTDGTLFIKKINVNLYVSTPAHIQNFSFTVDKEWIKENPDMNKSQSFSKVPHNEIFIDDIAKGEKYSLHELGNKLTPLDGRKYGVFEKEEKFDNAFIVLNNMKLKIASYKIGYSISRPINSPFEMDFSKELIGVIEYLQKGIKKSIFRDGNIR